MSEEETVIFVDIDLTLVNTRLHKMFQLSSPENSVAFWYRMQRCSTVARPSAVNFLQTIKQQYSVKCLTLGYSKFQSKVLTALSLDDHVGEIYGPDNFENLTVPRFWVLVDDMRPCDQMAEIKLNWLGHSRFANSNQEWEELLERHYIQCGAFDGTSEPHSLDELIEVIQLKLEWQKDRLLGY
ncbi:MAG: hypothetical protein K8F91_01560 [Candidatus Obscuribacterales bacterium]|nr:hypothetical protein [Candidatus Obscuribacterales bacterium]